MLDPAVLIGAPLDFKGKIKIYPPTVRDVITNPEFITFLRILTITQEDLRDELKIDNPPTPFEFLLINCYKHPQVAETTIRAFEYLCHTKVDFLYDDKKILIGDSEKILAEINELKQVNYITEEDYFDFQNMVRKAVGEAVKKPPEPINPNEDPRIRRIKEKARERDRIKAKQSLKGGISLETCLVAICCMGIGITPLNIGEMSYASVGEIMKVMQDKEKYDIDIKSLLAGADSKKVKPKYWIRNNNE